MERGGRELFKGEVSGQKAVEVSNVEEDKILFVRPARLEPLAKRSNEEPNFPPVALLLCLQCGSRLPCPTLADEWRSLADVDDCWRVGLLQQMTAQFASVACLEPRAHLNGDESQSQRWPIRRR